MSRFYVSVNARKIDLVKKSLQHYLIDHEDTNLTNLDRLVASLAMKKGTALTKRFLFDYDDDKGSIDEFLEDISREAISLRDVSLTETPNGYAVVAEHGFDTRNLLEKWKNVELKRDGMLFIQSAIKKESGASE